MCFTVLSCGHSRHCGRFRRFTLSRADLRMSELLAFGIGPYYLPCELSHRIPHTHTHTRILDLLYANVKDAYSSGKHCTIYADTVLFPNTPWVTPDLEEKKRAFASEDREELERVQRELKFTNRKCKYSYRRRLKLSIWEVWQGLKQMLGHNRWGFTRPLHRS